MRDLIWIGRSRDDLSAFPKDVKRGFGFRLRQIQAGETPPQTVALAEFGSGVFELKEWERGNTFRVVYAVKLARGVYVLHAFMKKSKSERALPREDAALIVARLKRAREVDRDEGD